MFEDIYDFAGKLRNVNIAKGNFRFAPVIYLEAALENIDKIDDTRYESYLAFIDEAKEYKERVKYEGKKQEHSKKVVHNKEIAKISGKKRQSARNTLRQQIIKEIENE